MRNVYLTSFFRSHQLPEGVVPYSAAVYQPKGYMYPKVAWTDIRNSGGGWTRPRDFIHDHDPLKGYHDTLMQIYLGRYSEARTWADNLEHDVALCCWCPYDKAAQRQLGEHGSFVCHTEVLEEFIHDKLGLQTWSDHDRRSMKHLAN